MPHGDSFFVDDVPISHSPAVADAVRGYLSASCRIILESLGRESVAALFVSGSAASGEVTALDSENGEPVVLSDIDLAVVMKSDAHRDRAKVLRPSLRRQMSNTPQASSMCAPPELGVYSLTDLAIQARKMGVLEIAVSGKVLWGDRRVFERLPRFKADEIPREEALALLFNRSLEILEAIGARFSPNSQDQLRLLYAGAKAYLDAGTSLVAYHGRYAAGYRERLEWVQRVLADHMESRPATLQADQFLDGLSFWTDFKLTPDLDKVFGRYGADSSSSGLGEVAWKTYLEARRPLLEVWLTLVESEGAGEAGGILGACRSLLGRESTRVKLGGWKRVFLGGGEVPFTRVLRLAAVGSPLFLLRLCAMCLVDQYGPRVGADPLTDVKYTDEHPVLDRSAFNFLRSFFPAGQRGASGGGTAEEWRRQVVDVWRLWTERFWS